MFICVCVWGCIVIVVSIGYIIDCYVIFVFSLFYVIMVSVWMYVSILVIYGLVDWFVIELI